MAEKSAIEERKKLEIREHIDARQALADRLPESRDEALVHLEELEKNRGHAG